MRLSPFALPLALVCVAALAAPSVQAQVGFGLKGGLNTAWQVGPDANNLDPRLGAVGGIVVRAPLTYSLGVQAEGLYSQKGQQSSISDAVAALDYVEIPVLARAALSQGYGLNVGVTAGPYVGIPVSTKVRSSAGDLDLETKTDLGVAVGIDVGAGPYSIDARYSAGFVNVIDDPTFGRPEARNQAFTITFQALFGR